MEQAYGSRIKHYIYFHGVHHQPEMGDPSDRAFLTHLATSMGNWKVEGFQAVKEGWNQFLATRCDAG